MHFVKPRRDISFIRETVPGTLLISPASPISPNATVLSGIGLSFRPEIKASAIERSTAGSSMRSPPITPLSDQ
jgi:hypothetical protein